MASEYEKNYPCNTCKDADSCDEWDARYCCLLCEYLGVKDCDDCDPMDI